MADDGNPMDPFPTQGSDTVIAERDRLRLEVERLRAELAAVRKDWADDRDLYIDQLGQVLHCVRNRPHWTADLPEEPGWYWLREARREDRIVEVAVKDDRPWVIESDFRFVAVGIFARALWAGPIARPAEPEGKEGANGG